MKLASLITCMGALALAGCASTYNTAPLDATFVSSEWDGVTIPAGQQCQKFGGDNPATPELMISHIPSGSDAIVLAYSDRDSERMNNGGHGIIKYDLNAIEGMAKIPSVPGHSYILPADFTLIAEHKGPNWDKAGAYMPPCSGGKDHEYYITIKTMQGDQITAEKVIEMGKY